MPLKERFTTELKRVEWGRTFLLVALILALFAALWQYLMPETRTVTSTEFRKVAQVKEVEKIRRVPVPGPERVVTLEKEKVVRQMVYLPAEVKDDPKKEVIATAELPPSEAGYQTATVMDLQTGESVPYAREKEMPFLQFTNRLELGVHYGLSTAVGQMGQATLRHSFLRTGPLKWDILGEVNTRPEAKALAGFHLDLLP